MPRRLPQRTWTPNQIVARNVALARLKRGWTQDQAAEALAPYLGSRLSPASWSAIERSIEGRPREFTADELVAFARGFELPIGWFLTPPSSMDNVRVATPDTKGRGLDPLELFDLVLGTPDTLAEWRELLLSWPAGGGHRARILPDGSMENLGRTIPDVHQRLADPAELRAKLLLRQRFGDIDRAADVLRSLIDLLTELDEPTAGETRAEERPTRKPPRRQAP